VVLAVLASARDEARVLTAASLDDALADRRRTTPARRTTPTRKSAAPAPAPRR
jgi:hypothetical protein